MARDPETVEIFECEGSFSFLREPQRFTFRVHSDSSLRVDIEPLQPQLLTTASRSLGDVHTRHDTTAAAAIDIERRDREGGESTIELEEEGELDDHTGAEDGDTMGEEAGANDAVEGDVKLMAYDGRALVEMQQDQEAAASVPACYVVHFKLVQWSRGAQGVWSQIIKCVARISRKHGALGRFVELRENADEAQEFTLKPVAYRVESLLSPLHPLTPGQYDLRGITIGENAFVYECNMTITLQANGMVSGTSQELPFAQECPLAGAWTCDGLNFLLQYEMHGNKHTYVYFGTPFQSGLRGIWQNSELRVVDNVDPRTGTAERGCLELELVSATRVWSEKYHKDYPA
ncbi:hypothetical protein BBJ28_00026496, partial [Nothophytophthora sp. Chile5]